LEGSYRFMLGDAECFVVSDGEAPFGVRNLFENAPEEELRSALAGHGITGDTLMLPFQPLVVRLGRETILLDSGMGPGASPTLGLLPDSLREIGIAPEDVTAVVLSHGHYDHVGGAVASDGRLLYPKANHFICREELAFWETPEALARAGEKRGLATQAKLALLRDHLTPFSPGDEVLPGVRSVPAYGHTPYNLALRVTSGDASLLYVADALAHPIHFQHPDWHLNPDLDPPTALGSRHRFLEESVTTGELLCGYHLPLPAVGHVARAAADAYRWHPLTA
jgi:glyoxylase-like metal-dependent hydrolase (beta-lactamase superfamily II)